MGLDNFNQEELKRIKKNLAQEQDLLKQYEDELRFTADPREKLRLTSNINRQKTTIANFKDEYLQLEKEISSDSSKPINPVARNLSSNQSRIFKDRATNAFINTSNTRTQIEKKKNKESKNLLKRITELFQPSSNSDNLPIKQETGLFSISLPQNPGVLGDIIFVHGLGGHQWNTWHWQKPDDPNRQEENSWLYRLAKEDDLKDLSVWTFGYDAAKFFLEGRSASRFEQARLLLGFLKGMNLGQKSLFFVTHSLGGLVVKEMLRVAQTNDDPILKQVRGIVFLATPHIGSDLVRSAKFLSTISVKLLTPSINTRELEASAPELRSLDEWYRNNAVKLNIHTLPFYEMYDTWGFKVVDEDSGNPKVPNQEFCTPVPTDHIQIAKVRLEDSLVYPRVKQFILNILGNISQSTNAPINKEQLLSLKNDESLQENMMQYDRGKLRKLINGLTDEELNSCLDGFSALITELNRQRSLQPQVETILQYFDKKQYEFPDFMNTVKKHSPSTYNIIYGNK